jgi:hypothetical protein
MRAWCLLSAVVVAASSTGCAGASLVAARAADDLHCPRGELTVESREMGAYDVRGCGKHASYVVRAGEVMPDSGAQDDLPAKMPKGEE